MNFKTVLVCFSVLFSLAACGSVPIANVQDAGITSASGKELSNAQVRSAIMIAGAGLGWQIKEESPNLLVGTLSIRKHVAVIEIPYSPTQYSIKYRSSVNLDNKGDYIHKNYNGWIQNLNRSINAQLVAS